MAWVTPVADDLAIASHVSQIIQALNGTVAKGQAISLTALDDSANYALVVKNLDANNEKALDVQDSDGTSVLTIDADGITVGANVVMAASETVDTIDVSAHTHTGAAGHGALIPATGLALANIIRVYRSTVQSIANSTYTALSFDTEVVDTNAGWAAGSPTNLTAKVAGAYLVAGHLSYQSPVSDKVSEVLIRKEGSVYVASQRVQSVDTTAVYLSVSAIIELDVDEYVEVMTVHSHGSAKDVAAASATNQHHCSASMALLGRIA